MMAAEAVVKVKGLHKRFGGLEVLKGVDFEVDRGEVVVVIGPVRQRQEHAAALHQLPRGPHGRDDRGGGIRLEGGHRTAKQRERIRQLRHQGRHGLPAVQPLSAHDGRSRT